MVAHAGEFNPADPGWRAAAELVLGDDFLRDLLLVQMIGNRSWAAAIPSVGNLPLDPRGNRDGLLAAALWLNGDTGVAEDVAALSGNRLAQQVGLLIRVQVDAQVWAKRMVEAVAPGPVAPYATGIVERRAAKHLAGVPNP
jgi:hypothetical protein